MKDTELEKTNFYNNIKHLIPNPKEFSRNCNIEYRTLQNIYYKISKPSIDKIIILSKALNISIDDLLYKDFTKEQKTK